MPKYLQNTVNEIPACQISDAFGESLEAEVLVEIATAFAFVDYELLLNLELVLKRASRGGLSPDLQRKLQQELATVVAAQKQFLDVNTGRRKFCKQYLRENSMLPLWRRAFDAIFYFLHVHREDKASVDALRAFEGVFLRIAGAISSLGELLKAAIAQGILGSEERGMIRLRMLALDEAFDTYHRETSSPRTLKTWPEIRRMMDVSSQSTSIKTKSNSSKSATVIFWSTVATTIFITLPSFIKAYQYSPHQPGTTEDADFWLLIQSSFMQILNLGAAAVSIQQNRGLSNFTRVVSLAMIGLGFLCVLSAMVLYTRVPIEWSAMINCMGGAVQAFALVQMLLEKKEKTHTS